MLSLQTFSSLAEFCTDGTKSLTDVPFADGYIEGQGFPCEHLNYFWNNFTSNGAKYQAALTSIENEIINVLTQASITPSSGDNTQLYDAIDYQIKHTETSAALLTSGTLADARFPGTLPAISGVNLTNLNANSLSSGTMADARFPNILPAISGANLTDLNAANLTGNLALARTVTNGTCPPIGATFVTRITGGSYPSWTYSTNPNTVFPGTTWGLESSSLTITGASATYVLFIRTA